MLSGARGGGAGRPPAPPPRDPDGVHSVVQRCRERQQQTKPNRDEEDMSSDSSSPPRPTGTDKRRSSYENVPEPGGVYYPSKPPSVCRSRRDTPSPRPVLPQVRASPRPGAGSPCRQDSWSDALSDDPGGGETPVRRRPPSACRAPRSHRGSMPPVECWGHRGACAPAAVCCGAPSPVPFYWGCGATQTWPHCAMRQNNDSYECDDLQQRICQLEVEKEQLTLQVNVLSDQVEAQSEKIMELESSLSQSKEQLETSESMLKKEMIAKSSIESNKLDLIAQVTALRLRLNQVENEKRDIEEKNSKLEYELILTAACLAEKEADLATLKSKLVRNGSITPIFEASPELEKLKGALSSVIAANDEKERRIQEMKISLNRYKKLHELVLLNNSKKNVDDFSKKVPFSEESFHSALKDFGATDFSDINELMFEYNLAEKPPPVPRQIQQSLTLLSIGEELRKSSSRLGDLSRQSPLFTPIRGESPSPFSSLNIHPYNNLDKMSPPPTPQKTPPSKRHYSTLPRPHQTDLLNHYTKPPNESPRTTLGQTSHSFHNLHHTSLDASRPTRITKPSSGMSFGKGFFKLRLGKRSSSAPQLAPDNFGDISPCSQLSERTSPPLSAVPPKEKAKGLRKIFGRVKRSGSENLNTYTAELKRGGIRATAGPRLGWSEDTKEKRDSAKFNQPFIQWDSSMICDWMLSLGLSMYVPDCKKWVKNGEQLLKATTNDFEKELNIKNPLHRKKLLLAITGAKEPAGDVVEPAGKIDHQWVVRWLDDIGLPHYKDAFYDARIDGRMLHHLTLEDLSHLKVTNLLHHISIKTGIQVLRENNFDPICLKRRSVPEDENSPRDVSQWTNHRVMEWLRTVDLSEYAPNLRGSGVHGGLMVYEPRFNADLMATLLNIPPSKTLLRRHLSTQFKQLIGPEIMQKKREWEDQPTYTPLSPSAKVKTIKRSPFSLVKRKHRAESELEDYVCPIDVTGKMFASTPLLNNSQNRTEEEKFLMKEMAMKKEKILENMPASNV